MESYLYSTRNLPLRLHFSPRDERRRRRALGRVTNRRCGNFESTRGRAIIPARLFNGNSEHFSQERLCNQAGRRMPGSGCCHWATIPANEVLAFALLECGRTAEL